VSVGASSVAVLSLPLGAAALCALLRSAKLAHAVAALAMVVAAVFAVGIAIDVVGSGATVAGPHAAWLDCGGFTLGVGTMIDPMGAVMASIVCVLGVAVLVFNSWYMHGDPLAARFPWQMCFFLAAMLGVVLADNLFLSFCCWELVGLGSYLLIGFWFDKPVVADDPEYQRQKGANARGVLERRLNPAYAQLKAFVMNRVGDAGFLIGIGALLALSLQLGGSGDVLGWGQLFALPQRDLAGASLLGCSGSALLLLGALGVFAGAMGKSAQFPLHPWLPDAMQGPTTASSIIHAATMVAAGVFLVARCYPLFPADALAVVGWIGGFTCLFAASIACVQWDLKAVLAYSTVSQLGLMFVGLGAGDEAGGRAAGIAHLFTHAFFKCLLFLCAGAVIHAAAGCQDLNRLGGLRKKMPVTAWCSLAAVLAIGGAPLFGGFYSKDAVLAAALANAHERGTAGWVPFVFAVLGSLLTSAYMLRWWFRLFAGEPRDAHVVDHAHDPAGAAKIVLLALAPLALALPWTAGGWLDAALKAPHGEAHESAHGASTWLSLALLAAGALFATYVFWLAPRRGVDAANGLATAARPLHVAASELWGIDTLWDLVWTRGVGSVLARAASALDLGGERRVRELETPAAQAWSPSVDGLVDGVAQGCARLGRGGSWLHQGRLGLYLAVAFGVAALCVWWESA
jgi:NADH-quinone oxidoreductase subunit L